MSKKEYHIALLNELEKQLHAQSIDAQVDKSVEGRYRIIVPYLNGDKFLIDFSGEVKDGIRIGFILDIHQPNQIRRKEFQAIIKKHKEQLEESLSAHLLERKSNPTILNDGRETWLKSSTHRRMGFHQYIRIKGIDLKVAPVDITARAFLPYLTNFIAVVKQLLGKIHLPAS